MKKINLLIASLILILLSGCSNPPSASTFSHPTLGNADAKVLVEEFSDFQCPACGQISPQLDDVIERNSDIAKLVYYNFPLSYHQYAFKSAEAGLCAFDQGKFWEFSKKAFADQENLTDDNLKKFASDLGLDMDKFNKCFESGEKKTQIASDQAEGNSRQLEYTPSIYVNGKLVQWSSSEEFEKYIKSL